MYMNLKINKTAIVPVMIIFFTTSAPAGYAPWKSDVLTGDALSETYKTDNSGRVYNGAQGGAFFLLRFFQVVISPQDGANCRHIPTCSSYAKHAVLMHGSFIGSVLAGDRLIRCNPFYPPSVDPVPEKPFGK